MGGIIMPKIEVKVKSYDGGLQVDVFNKKTSELIDHGTGYNRELKMPMQLECYSITKADIQELLHVGTTFINTRILPDVHYIVPKIGGPRTLIHQGELNTWLNQHFKPYQRTDYLKRNDLSDVEYEKLVDRLQEVTKLSDFQDTIKEWVKDMHRINRLLFFKKTLGREIDLDRLTNFPLVPLPELKFAEQVTFDHPATTLKEEALSGDHQVSLQYVRRQMMLSNAIEWKFGTGKRPMTLFQGQYSNDSLAEALSQDESLAKISGIINRSEYMFTFPYQDRVNNSRR